MASAMITRGFKTSRKTYLLEAMSRNRRLIAAGYLLYFFILFVEGLAVSILINGENSFAFPGVVTLALIVVALTIFLIAVLTLWAYLRGDKAIMRLFYYPDIPTEARNKVSLALEGIRLATGLERLDAQVVSMDGVNTLTLARGWGGGTVLLSSNAVEELDRRELEALLAHEAYHVQAHDTWLWMQGMAISAFLPILLSGYLNMVREMFEGERLSWYLLDFRLRLIIAIYLGLAWLFLAVFWIPIWFFYYLLILSRNRDFEADAHAVMLTKDPDALINVLKKADIMRTHSPRPGLLYVSFMLFHKPLERPGTLSSFFSRFLTTHPAIEERMERVASSC